VVVFLHGLVETERSWFHKSSPGKSRTGTDFGSRLAEDLSYSPVYVRYNTGRRIHDNGRELVGLLAELVREWPVPITEVVLIGHSMGGLVVRSAVFQAREQDAPWLPKVTRLVCLGTPHTGALLERGVVRVAGLFGRWAVLALSAEVGRWPSFVPEAVACGVVSMLCFQLFVSGDSRGALNLFRAAGPGSTSSHKPWVGCSPRTPRSRSAGRGRPNNSTGRWPPAM
jgi:pimeloyl-ACP methyl ester carboxylesterase